MAIIAFEVPDEHIIKEFHDLFDGKDLPKVRDDLGAEELAAALSSILAECCSGCWLSVELLEKCQEHAPDLLEDIME